MESDSFGSWDVALPVGDKNVHDMSGSFKSPEEALHDLKTPPYSKGKDQDSFAYLGSFASAEDVLQDLKTPVRKDESPIEERKWRECHEELMQHHCSSINENPRSHHSSSVRHRLFGRTPETPGSNWDVKKFSFGLSNDDATIVAEPRPSSTIQTSEFTQVTPLASRELMSFQSRQPLANLTPCNTVPEESTMSSCSSREELTLNRLHEFLGHVEADDDTQMLLATIAPKKKLSAYQVQPSRPKTAPVSSRAPLLSLESEPRASSADNGPAKDNFLPVRVCSLTLPRGPALSPATGNVSTPGEKSDAKVAVNETIGGGSLLETTCLMNVSKFIPEYSSTPRALNGRIVTSRLLLPPEVPKSVNLIAPHPYHVAVGEVYIRNPNVRPTGAALGCLILFEVTSKLHGGKFSLLSDMPNDEEERRSATNASCHLQLRLDPGASSKFYLYWHPRGYSGFVEGVLRVQTSELAVSMCQIPVKVEALLPQVKLVCEAKENPRFPALACERKSTCLVVDLGCVGATFTDNTIPPMPKFRKVSLSLPDATTSCLLTSSASLSLWPLSCTVKLLTQNGFHIALCPSEWSADGDWSDLDWRDSLSVVWQSLEMTQVTMLLRFMHLPQASDELTQTSSLRECEVAVSLQPVPSDSGRELELCRALAVCRLGPTTGLAHITNGIEIKYQAQQNGPHADLEFIATPKSKCQLNNPTYSLAPRHGHRLSLKNTSLDIGLVVRLRFVLETEETPHSVQLYGAECARDGWRLFARPDTLHMPPHTDCEFYVVANFDRGQQRLQPLRGRLLLTTDISKVDYEVGVQCRVVTDTASLSGSLQSLRINQAPFSVDKSQIYFLGVPIGKTETRSFTIVPRPAAMADKNELHIRVSPSDVFGLKTSDDASSPQRSLRVNLTPGGKRVFWITYSPATCACDYGRVSFSVATCPNLAYRIHIRGYGGRGSISPMDYYACRGNEFQFLQLRPTRVHHTQNQAATPASTAASSYVEGWCSGASSSAHTSPSGSTWTTQTDESVSRWYSLKLANVGPRDVFVLPWVQVSSVSDSSPPGCREITSKYASTSSSVLFTPPSCLIPAMSTRKCSFKVDRVPRDGLNLAIVLYYIDDALRTLVIKKLQGNYTDFTLPGPVLGLLSAADCSTGVSPEMEALFPVDTPWLSLVEIGGAVRHIVVTMNVVWEAYGRGLNPSQLDTRPVPVVEETLSSDANATSLSCLHPGMGLHPHGSMSIAKAIRVDTLCAHAALPWSLSTNRVQLNCGQGDANLQIVNQTKKPWGFRVLSLTLLPCAEQSSVIQLAQQRLTQGDLVRVRPVEGVLPAEGTVSLNISHSCSLSSHTNHHVSQGAGDVVDLTLALAICCGDVARQVQIRFSWRCASWNSSSASSVTN